MTNKQIGFIGAKILLVILIGGGIFSWLSYYFDLENQNKEWYRKQYVLKGFNGVIKKIGTLQNNSFV